MTEMNKTTREADRVDSPFIAATDELTLVDQLLTEQRTLTAVERFSQKHAQATQPIQSKYYKDLIPIRKPSSGEQYAFEVDMDKCTGCKACVVACHSLNGLKEQESWRDVGIIRGLVDGVSEQQTVTTACHHCLDPGCLSGCPVGAYEKMPDTGIVRHLDDQCIGCQYCSLKCPYDVPKYDDSLGIVRKCDMCHERLADGEAPACVQSCPNGAISIQLIDVITSEAVARQGGSMVAGAFRSDYTLPTTTFRSARRLSDTLSPADEKDLSPAHAHTPLVWMLMLTQVAVGITLAEGLYQWTHTAYGESFSLVLSGLAVILGNIGLAASVLHLGSPLGAWRSFLGLRTSWLSREIVLFGLWMPALIFHTLLVWHPMYHAFLPNTLAQYPLQHLLPFTSAVSILLGIVSVFCSVMVYVDTKRDFWSLKRTAGRFFGTCLLGASAAFATTEAALGGVSTATTLALLTSLGLKAVVEYALLKPAQDSGWSFAKKSALIQTQSLRSVLTLRWCCFLTLFLCGVLSPWLSHLAMLALPVTLLGEWLERRLFFQAVVTLKMPGELNQESSH